MTDVDLDAIEQRCKAATPGPWTWERDTRGFCRVLLGDSSFYPPGDAIEFIAHALTDVPLLLARVRELGILLELAESHALTLEARETEWIDSAKAAAARMRELDERAEKAEARVRRLEGEMADVDFRERDCKSGDVFERAEDAEARVRELEAEKQERAEAAAAIRALEEAR